MNWQNSGRRFLFLKTVGKAAVLLFFGICFFTLLQKHPREIPTETEELLPIAKAFAAAGALELRSSKAEEIKGEEQFRLQERQAERIEEILSGLTLEEKVAQLFLVTPEALTGTGPVTSAGEETKAALWEYPVGGLIYFPENIVSSEQIKEMIQTQQNYSIERIGLPLFISIDEEGGSVARIANDSPIAVRHFPDMAEIGASKDALAQVGELGDTIGGYLSELGFNLDFAPVADVLTNPDNTLMKRRSFGEDASHVAELAAAAASHLKKQGVYGCLKHFPGHGATAEDSHKGFACTVKTLEELKETELIPFQKGIDDGISFIMAGHISAPNVTGDDLPASLSEQMITGLLREEMQFDGIVVTDAMNMGAVSNLYGSGEAAERAVCAGVDMILMPADFKEAYEGLLNAVAAGRLEESRIDASVRRILAKKRNLPNLKER